MSIDKEYGKYRLVCDICEDCGIEDCRFDEAVDYKKENGWISRKVNGEWKDICPDCK